MIVQAFTFLPEVVRRAVRSVLLRLLVAFILCFSALGIPGAVLDAAVYSPREMLQIRYREFRASTPGAGMPPIEVRSLDNGEHLRAEVFGLLKQPFDELADALLDPAEWCRFIPLNFNIKACTYKTIDDTALLTFYAGRKIYQSPDEAFRLRYRFDVEARKEGYFRITLRADEGPMGTRDYRMLLEAMAVEEGSFVRFRSSYRPSLRSRLATSGYLATLGRSKVGFTILGYDDEGKPVYVQGVKGIVERNAVRYFLALKAYMNHRQLPSEEGFKQMLEAWYRLNESYPVQLHEQEREEYLRIKRRERENQLELQRRVDSDRLSSAPGLHEAFDADPAATAIS